MYVFLQMPQNTFLAVDDPDSRARRSMPHYATLDRPWGPSPLVDQQLAGAVMWLAGDFLFIAAIIAIVAGWMRFEERDSSPGRSAGRRRARSRSGTARSSSPSDWPDQQEQHQGS